MEKLHFEDFHVGQRIDCGTWTVTLEEILAFARQFDPQPFHLDEAAAKQTHFGGVVASGWHTASLCMRLVVDAMLNKTVSLGSPGIDELRWLKPVRPGDTLRAVVEVAAMKPSQSKPDRGSMQVKYVLENQRGEPVMTMLGWGMIGRRPA